MRYFILILPIFLMAGTCSNVEYVYLPPEIPTETLTPCQISERKVKTVNELAALATEHLQSAQCANGKIDAIAEIYASEIEPI